MLVKDKIIATASHAASNSGEKRRSEVVRRFAEQFTQEVPKLSPRWERAIETHNRVKSETVTY